MAKNLDYEILRAVAERKPEYMQNDAVYIFKLLEVLCPKLSGEDKSKTLEIMSARVRFLAADGLIKMGSAELKEFSNYHGMIQSITPEGRVLLDRLESNRWQSRWSERAIGAFCTIVTGIAVAALCYFLNLDGNASGVVK